MALENRFDFVMIFDVENGNPNGDPDAGNSPRIDPESGLGFITDVCLKRKIRNYVELVKEGEPGYNILIKPDSSLNAKFAAAYDAEGLEKGKKGSNDDSVKKARDYICRNYYDVRTFGAVMSTGDNPCGIVRGPVQINFAKSISPISIQEVAITRQARTTDERTATGNTEIGRKSVIPYALYRSEGYVSAALANKATDLSNEDVELLFDAIVNMFENDHSAARGKMVMRKLYVFKHDNVLGACPSHILFEKIDIKQKNPEFPARSFSNYEITVDDTMPEGVELICKI
ncbi:MAG: type I-C CRISPR-associated protein Cas7/Csd2 [Clostridia bacterium]|nr:type I-C CRISPR-associated protein Cas7/Csd2 [Clostridia bacterium]